MYTASTARSLRQKRLSINIFKQNMSLFHEKLIHCVTELWIGTFRSLWQLLTYETFQKPNIITLFKFFAPVLTTLQQHQK